MATNWLEFGAESKRALKGPGGEKTRARRAVDMFCSWANDMKVPFPLMNPDGDEKVIADFSPTLDVYKKANGDLKREGQLTLETAQRLLTDARKQQQNKEAQARIAEAERAALTAQLETADDDEESQLPEETMSTEPDDQNEELQDEQYEEEVEQPAPPRRGKVAGQPVMFVSPAALRRPAAPRQAQPRIPGFNRPASALIEKVDEGGHTVRIDVFTVEEMKGMTIQEFIERRIAQRNMNEDGSDTTFIATMLGANGKPTSTSVEVEIGGDGAQQQVNDPFRAVDGALNMVERLKGKFGQPEQRPDATMEAMKQKAISNNDMMTLMMVMMMERNQRPVDNTQDLTRLVTTILEKQGLINNGAPPAMPMMMPPPPTESVASTKLLDLALAKMAQPAPTAAEQMMEMLKMRQMMSDLSGGGGELAGLRQELERLRAQVAGATAPKPHGLMDSVKEFETVTTMVKSLAPQVTGDSGGGGFAGILRALATPQMGDTIARALAPFAPNGGAGGQPPQQPAQPQQPVQVKPVTPTQPVQQPVQQPAQPAQPAAPAEKPEPQAVVDAEKAVKLAQTPPAVAERFAALITAMVMSNDERYMVHLQPVINELTKPVIGIEELKPARGLLLNLIGATRPEYASPEFADTVLAALATSIGMDMPPALAETAGQWTVLFNGKVVMLSELGAQPVKAEAPTATAPAAPATPPVQPPVQLRPPMTPEEAKAALEAERAQTALQRQLEEQNTQRIEPVLTVPEQVHA